MPDEAKPAAAQRPGFLREGWRELGRRLERRKLQKQMAAQGRERHEALARLGQRAWQEKMDLSAFPALHEQLSRLEARAEEVNATAHGLDAERVVLERRRAADAAKHDARRRAVEEKKQPADAALLAARERHGGRARRAQQLEARASTLADELAAVTTQIATLTAGGSAALQSHLVSAQARQQELLSDKAQVSLDLSRAQAEIPASVAEVNRLTAESLRYGEEISGIEAARKAALAETDAALDRVRVAQNASQQQTTALLQEQGNRFAVLGLALYEQKDAAAALAEPMQRIAGLDQGRDATQSALQASLAQTRAMPQNTMLKFFSALLLIPLCMLAAMAGIYLLLVRP